MKPKPKTVVFDLGGVLIDWNPRYVYRDVFSGNVQKMETFLRDVCSPAWNHKQDEGRTWREAVDELVRQWPDQAELIRLYWTRWPDMLKGPIAGTVRILESLSEANVPLYAVTNWSAETYGIAEARFGFLSRFRDVVVSGRERVAKPDPRIFQILIERNGLAADDCFFIDDVRANVEAAEAVGMTAIQFTTPGRLDEDLRSVLQGIPKI